MAKYEVSFTVEILGNPPIDEVEDFIRFELGESASVLVTHAALKNRDLQSCDVRGVDVREA